MTREQWAHVETLFDEARQQPAASREAWLRATGADEDIRTLVLGMLVSYDSDPEFLETESDVVAAVGELLADGAVGQRLGAYRIVRQVGQGGMGVVYEGARADDFARRVAIKMLRHGMDTDLLVRRFRHERQILASLDHPNIAGLFDGGSTADGLPYFVMEFVDGVPIDRDADAQRLSIPDRLRLCLRVIDAVHYAHERQIVHRDLKPSNVLVTRDGHPKLLDFGIAKLLDASADGSSTLTALSAALTPDYTTPEQVRGEPVTPATDVYALGLLLYELLAGHRAYRLAARTPSEIARVICDEEPTRPSVAVARSETVTRSDGTATRVTPESVSATRDATPEGLRAQLAGGLDALVLRALRKDPRYRYQTVRALADDLRRYLDHEPLAATAGAWRYRFRRAGSRHRLALAAA
ncbi:MAG: serine/threonine protein kinase, partial [Acidobacteria bacterium]|nr:serine/threonine protein kinase [Acidobacteriota bacterium]